MRPDLSTTTRPCVAPDGRLSPCHAPEVQQPVAASLHEAGHHAFPRKQDMQRDPPPPRAMGIEQLADRRLDMAMAQGGLDKPALPVAVGAMAPMLQGAAAAAAEMGAGGGDAIDAGLQHLQQPPALALDSRAHCFAR